MAVEFISSLIVLSILGIFISGYLIKNRMEKKQTVCPIGGECKTVLESKWNSVFGIKNDIVGLIYYVFILIIALYIFFFQQSYPLFATITTAFALLFSLILVFIQGKIIKEYCFYCLISAGINLLIFVNVLVL